MTTLNFPGSTPAGDAPRRLRVDIDDTGAAVFSIYSASGNFMANIWVDGYTTPAIGLALDPPDTRAERLQLELEAADAMADAQQTGGVPW